MKYMILLISTFILTFCAIVCYLIDSHNQKIRNFKVPEDYVLVLYSDNQYVIMDRDRKNFLCYDGVEYAMYGSLKWSALIDSERTMKCHLIDALKQFEQEKVSLDKENQLKNHLQGTLPHKTKNLD